MSRARLKVTRFGDTHVVRCPACSGNDLVNLYVFPWLRAADLADAMWWANWHAAEHTRTRCQSCDRDHKIPPVEVLDQKTAKVGDRLFVRTGPGAWAEAIA